MKNSISLFSSYRFTHIILMLIVLALIPLTSQAEKREFDLSIEDTRIVLVGKEISTPLPSMARFLHRSSMSWKEMMSP